jgi:myo-inositol-1-phosphate synthase
MSKIRVAIAGIGNCASALIQGISFYSKSSRRSVPGLMHPSLGGYSLKDIAIVAVFDIDRRKVGKTLKQAIFALPNCTTTITTNIINSRLPVHMGPILDGIAPHMRDLPPEKSFLPAPRQPVDVVKILRQSRADMLVNFLPVGSQKAVEFYAQSALKAGVGFINCIPVFIASNPVWAKQFQAAKLPVIGDDVKSQVGATITHRVLAQLFQERGVILDRTYQLNIGGNTDFSNMLDRSRLASKKQSKTEAVRSLLKTKLTDANIHIGPSDFVPWLNDQKVAYIRMQGRKFGELPLIMETRLQVEDSYNSAGVVVDMIRCLKIALDRKIAGPLTGPSAYFCKHPPQQFLDEQARQLVEDFISG